MSIPDHVWRRLLAAGAAVLAASGWLTLRGSSAESIPEPASRGPAAALVGSPTAQHVSLGINSCMATSCHGSRSSDSPTWQQAGRIWFERDPHAQSYTKLLSESSLKIAERLRQRKFEFLQGTDLTALLKNKDYVTLKSAIEVPFPDAKSSRVAAEELLLLIETALAEAASSKSLTPTEIRESLKLLSTMDTGSMSWEAATQWLCATRAHLIAAGLDASTIDHLFDAERSKARPFARIVQENYFDYHDRFQSNDVESYKAKLANLLQKTQP